MRNKKTLHLYGALLLTLGFSSNLAAEDNNNLSKKSSDSFDLFSIYEKSKDFDSTTLVSKYTYQKYLEKINESRSYLLPQADLNLNINRSEYNNDMDGTNYGASVGLSQDIYNKSNLENVSASEINAKVFEYNYKHDLQELIYRVTDSYFNVIKSKNLVEASEANKEALKEQMKQTKSKFDVGVLAITDYNEAKSEYDKVSAEHIQLVNDLQTSYYDLEKLTSVSRKQISLPSDNLIKKLETLGYNFYFKDPEYFFNKSMLNNFDYLSVLEEKNYATKRLDKSKAEYYPTVSFTTDLSSNKSNYDSYDSSSTTEAVLGLNLNFKIYTGGQITSSVEQFSTDYIIADENLKEKQRELKSNISQAYNDIDSSLSLIKAYEQSVLSSQSALDSAKSGKVVGTRTTLDVLDATNDLYSAKASLANAKYDYVLNLLNLEFLSGNVSEESIKEINEAIF